MNQPAIAKPITPKEAVCQFMGWDYAEANEYRYHYGRTARPVYSTRDGNVCAVPNGKQPPNKADFSWQEASGSTAEWCKSRGQTIYITKEG